MLAKFCELCFDANTSAQPTEVLLHPKIKPLSSVLSHLIKK